MNKEITDDIRATKELLEKAKTLEERMAYTKLLELLKAWRGY